MIKQGDSVKIIISGDEQDALIEYVDTKSYSIIMYKCKLLSGPAAGAMVVTHKIEG